MYATPQRLDVVYAKLTVPKIRGSTSFELVAIVELVSEAVSIIKH